MYVSKFSLMTSVKSSLKWVFFCALYPYVVMSIVYGGGASISALLFSYVAVMPTLLAIKVVKTLKEKSLDWNESIANKAKAELTEEQYSKALVSLKIMRKAALILIGLGFAKLLIDLFSLSSVISPSLNSFLIALLQIYYMAIIIARIKYEA